jgi:ribonuclease HI
MSKSPKYYVVWKGHRPGVYHSWAECQRQTSGFPEAQFRSFGSLAEAEQAFKDPDSVAPKEKKTLYYVVWQGKTPGIYTDWESCRKQIEGADHPKFKSFGSKTLAEKAFKEGPEAYEGRGFKKTRDFSPEEAARIGDPNPLSISVDAACNATTGQFEYRGVITESGTELFRVGPYPGGSNNIAEFLALVHALAYLKKSRSDLMIYSDSKYAMAWVKKKKANTKASGPEALRLVQRAEEWLKSNTYPNKILKWETRAWGEIPADFGRK